MSLFSFVRCGGSIGASSTPPIDIPTPVAQLSVSSPDDGGLVTITGGSGFADDGSTINIVNGTSSSLNLGLLDMLVPTAHAQTTQVVVATSSGSFLTTLEASSGDSINFTYILNGEQLTASLSVTDSQPKITASTSQRILDIDIDTANNSGCFSFK